MLYKGNSARYVLGISITLCLAVVARADDISFNADIRPILSRNCIQCHGPDAEHREADLRLDLEQGAKQAAIVPGDLDSELIARITSTDSDSLMPPPDSGKSLAQYEIELLRRWVAAGASWADQWAFVPPREHTVPNVESDWPVHWIDNFILHRQQIAGASPAADADNVTLVRRLYFDLIGLPPTPKQVANFLSDSRKNAYSRLVDELLASDHFGERMAMYWLDLVRYADTVGYHGDQDQSISPYRDYVIDAFNRDLPFDQFTVEQLAGDLLAKPTIDQRIATGYNRLLQTSHEGGVQPKEYLAIYAADRVRNVSAVWLGGTLGCAQCHDHKYDPYTSKDFYAMSAFFADIDEEGHFTKGSNSLPTARPPELDVLSRRQRVRLAEIDAQLSSLEAESCEEQTGKIAQLQDERKQLEQQRQRTMITVSLPTPRTTRILPRGNWLDDSGPIVAPAVPTFLGEVHAEAPTRLDLARWLTDPDQGAGLLTARVMANRFWYLCFGQGISRSLADFGGQGEPPTHPELLDNLATTFVKNGWSVKRLMKMIVMSRTYRQSSVHHSDVAADADHENRWYARQNRFRLPAEMIRDAALSSSGLLHIGYGGGSVKPYQPKGYYRHLNFPKRRYSYHGDTRQWRRGVYVHWQRQFLHPMLKAFDAPSREECTAQRPRSNTPLAALVLLNDPTFVEAARHLADLSLQQDNTDEARITNLCQRVLSRTPHQDETTVLKALLDQARLEYRGNESQAIDLLKVGEREYETSDIEELASWTTVSRAILNLSEATTRQ